MPSPLGHALGGVIAGGLVAWASRLRPDAERLAADQRATTARWWDVIATWKRIDPQVRLFAWLGMAADLDFLIGRHSHESHSIGATLLVALAVLAWHRRPALSLAAAAAYASHILLDWLGSDTVPPIGIMAMWPLTSDFYQSPYFVFDAISRRFQSPASWWHNLRAVVREILILGPLVALTLAAWPGWKNLHRPWRR